MKLNIDAVSGYIIWKMRTGVFFFFQAEDGIRCLVRSRGLGDVNKRQELFLCQPAAKSATSHSLKIAPDASCFVLQPNSITCLLYTSDAADERSSVDLGGRRIIKKKTTMILYVVPSHYNSHQHAQHLLT